MWEAIVAQAVGSAVKGGMSDNNSGPNLSGGSTVISGGAGDVALSHILDAQNEAPFWTWGGTGSSTPGWFGGGVSGVTGGDGFGLLLAAGAVLLVVMIAKKRGG